MKKYVPILIIGGGPVGLSMALALARQGIPALLIEKHSGPTLHPRARGVSMRTMELFNQWGNVKELLKYEFPKEAIRFIWATSLQGEEITRIEMKNIRQYDYGPIGASFVTQECVEAFLHLTLRNYPQTEILFSKEMIAFIEQEDGVTVRVLNRETQQEEVIHTQYLIAADGAHSRIRRQLDIELKGPDNLGRFCNVYCELDITKWTQQRPCIGFFFTDPSLANRSLFTAYGKHRWLVGMRFSPNNSKDDFTDDYCLQEIRRVVGEADLQVKIISKSFWTMAAQIAASYRQGRIFLVGDAAHRLPPTGGLGMNTGIQDAHNLAWKLAFVIKYQVGQSLLDTYYAERKPVAERNIQWSAGNAKRFVDIHAAIQSGDHEQLANKLHEQQKHLNYVGLDLGYVYHSSAILSENSQDISVSPDEYVPTTLPGSRAPYVQLVSRQQAISTLDLFEKSYVLLVGRDGHAWQMAAKHLSSLFLFPIKVYCVADNEELIDSKQIWEKVYEINASGAVLVRPDGFVAWRSKGAMANPQTVLGNVLKKINAII